MDPKFITAKFAADYMQRVNRVKHRPKLSHPDAPQAVRDSYYLFGATTRELADEFGCTTQAIRDCINFKTYHIPIG